MNYSKPPNFRLHREVKNRTQKSITKFDKTGLTLGNITAVHIELAVLEVKLQDSNKTTKADVKLLVITCDVRVSMYDEIEYVSIMLYLKCT